MSRMSLLAELRLKVWTPETETGELRPIYDKTIRERDIHQKGYLKYAIWEQVKMKFIVVLNDTTRKS